MSKLFSEVTVQKAAKHLGVDDSTLNRWLQKGLAPSRWKGRRRIVRQSVVAKIEMALSRHGSEWFKNVTWTPFDRAEVNTEEQPIQTQLFELEKVETNSECKIIVKELAEISKQLKKLNEHDLAAAVSLRAVELM